MKPVRHVNKHGMEYWKVPGSKPGKFYYVTPLDNPDANTPKKLWLCTCPSFTMGKVRMGLNPLVSPCKHIWKIWKKETE